MTRDEKLSELRNLMDKAKQRSSVFERISQLSSELQKEMTNKLRESAKKVTGSNYDEDALKGFTEHWWTVVRGTDKKGNPEATLVVPKQYNVNFGWLVNQDKGFNHFKVNAVTNFISEIPQEIKTEFGFPEPFDVVLDGRKLKGKDVAKIAQKYKNYGKLINNEFIIDQATFVDFLADLIRDGTMPFGEEPVPESIRVKRKSNLELSEPEQKAVNEYLKRSHVIVVYPTGFGKTFVAMGAMNEVTPPFLILANKMAIPEWQERIAEFLPEINESDYDIATYQGGVSKFKHKKYNLIIFDEAHKSVADTYSQLLQGNGLTTLALSATPFREDGRDELLMAIHGFAVGANWNDLRNSKYYNPPTVHVWIEKDEIGKRKRFEQLIKTDRKVLVFCDDIDFGNQTSKEYNIPFVNGQTPNNERMKIVQQNQICIVSRVGDESISKTGAEIGIEIDWFGTSRRQAMQRAGRLMHNKESEETEHHIIMTPGEFQKDKKRLSVYYEKGLKVLNHKAEGIKVTDMIVTNKTERKRILGEIKKLQTRNTAQKIPNMTKEINIDDLFAKYPLLKYPGVRKIYDSCNKPMRTGLLFFIDPSNLEKSFSIAQLELNLGMPNVGNNLANRVLNPLLKKNALRKQDGLFTQNFTSLLK